MKKAVIFDFDQTLVDSKISGEMRKSRDWQSVYKLIPKFRVYDGFIDVFNHLKENNIQVAIVTTSPGVYAQKVLNHFNIPYHHLVDFFKVKPIKPHPAPMLMAAEMLKTSTSNIISFGDRKIDIISSNLAGIESVACLWDSNENHEINLANPTYTINKPIDIIPLIK
jgi:phosphoglycolate phosphatase-like HAD superfamily hydrolase